MARLERKYTFCRLCEACCGFVAEIENNTIVNYYPDAKHPVSKGYGCIKGRRFIDLMYRRKRLKAPLKRVDGKYQPVPWDEAIDDIGGRLKEIRAQRHPNAIAAYFGNPVAFSYTMSLYGPAFMKMIGSRNVFMARSLGRNNKLAHSRMFYGSASIVIVPDFSNIKYFLALGTNPVASHFGSVVFPNPLKRFIEMERAGCKIVWINPRKTESAQKIGVHRFIQPNTYIFLLFGMIHYVLENNLEDKDFIDEFSEGIDRLREVAEEFGGDLDWVADLTGIGKKDIISIIRGFLKASKIGGAAVYGGVGTARGPFATMTAWAIDVLNFITGNIDKQGNFYSEGLFDASAIRDAQTLPRSRDELRERLRTGGRVARTMIDSMGVTGLLGNLTKMPKVALAARKSSGRDSSRIGNFPSIMGAYPASILAEEIMRPGDESVKALIVTAGDPLINCPNPRKLKKAFKYLDLLVSIDLFANDTGTMADYVLPAETFLERDDFSVTTSALNPLPFGYYTRKMVSSPKHVKPEWEIFNHLLYRMGLPILGDDPLALFIASLKDSDRKRFKSLLESKKGIYLTKDKTIQYNMLLPDKINFEDELIPLVPEAYEDEFKKLRKWKPERSKKYPYYLISGRQIKTMNSWINLHKSDHRCYISPVDALKLDLKNGSTVRVSSEISAIEIKVEVTESLMPGVIWIPHGWGRTNKNRPKGAVKKNGVNVNLIIDDDVHSLETFSGMARLDGIPVQVKKFVL